MEAVKPTLQPFMTHILQELIVDAELYSWKSFHSYHAVWLQQIKNGQVKWGNAEAKLQFCLAIIWHPAITTAKARTAATVVPPKKASKAGTFTNISSKLGILVCVVYHEGGCSEQGDHPTFAPTAWPLSNANVPTKNDSVIASSSMRQTTRVRWQQ